MIKCLLTFTSVLGMACIIAYTYFIWYCILKMEKLIELLNEYEWDWFVSIKWDEDFFKDDFFKHYTLQTISKSYWFIKWLVDNDKIDFNFVERVWSWDFIYDMDSPYYYSCTCKDLNEYNEVDRVLMLLAIQDEPIEFLCSILK